MLSKKTTEKMRINSHLVETLNEKAKNFERLNKKENQLSDNIYLDLEKLSSESDELSDNEENEMEESRGVI